MHKQIPASTKLPLRTQLAYGIGAAAFGVKDNGFGFFLLIFYGQVVGLDAGRVGLAMAIALVVDALADPIVGYWSDNLHSKWGRRHPFMYASAVPLAATYYLIWDPPQGWSQDGLFIYLLSLAILIRILITLYQTPSSALAPELTPDYDERATLISWRVYAQWTGGNAMSVLMFVVLFPMFATAAIPNGQFNREAYALYGVIAAVAIFVAIMLSALGTHARIPQLKAPPPKHTLTPATILKEVRETLSDRSFAALFIAGLFGAIAAGMSSAMAFYNSTYFWGFTVQQIGLMVLSVFVSAVLGSLLAPWVTRRFGKRTGAIVVGMIAFIASPMPIFLRLADVMPPNGSPLLFWIIFPAGLIDVSLIICFQILTTAMMADLVEQSELKTGRRSEGTFVAVSTFIQKMVSGLGVIAASTILTYAGLKTGAKPADVPPEVLLRLGAIYAPTLLTFWMLMMAAIFFYRLERGEHEENLRKLAERAGSAD